MFVSHVDRRTAIAGLAALGAGLTAISPSSAQSPVPATQPGIRGIGYDTGWGSPGDLSRTMWREEWMRGEIAAIADDLHCTHVLVFGSDVGRIAATAEVAVSHDLVPWLQPRLMNGSWSTTITQMKQTAAVAESLRADGVDVVLSLGAELPLFTLDIVPGATFDERMNEMYASGGDFAAWIERVNTFHAEAIPAVRAIFDGSVTYGAAAWEAPLIVWDRFDIVGINAYRTSENAATFADDLRSFREIGKPVVITEFGCCNYQGAEDRGGDGYNVIDWETSPPEIQAGLVYDEQVQADYVDELIGIFAETGMDGTFVYEFIQESPYAEDQRYNYDMVNFGITKTFEDGSERSYSESGYWEAKPAFDVLANVYGDR